MAGEVREINDGSFKAEVLDAQEPVLVDFTAAWCAPCRAIAPVLDDLATQYKGKVKITKLNVDENQGTAQAYGVRSLPTLLLFRKGAVVDQIVGAVPRAKLEERIKKVV